MLAERQEQQLAEIKALTYEVGTSTQLVLKRVREARGLLAAHGPLLAFVHIPKTAGGTATTMLARAYSPSAVHDAGNYMRGRHVTENKMAGPKGGWERWHRSGGRVSVGHVPYTVFRASLPPDSRYMTFLREPVDRVLSHYYRHVHHPNLSPADRAERRRMGNAIAGSLEEALVELDVPQLNNLATRFLCGQSSPIEGRLSATALDDAKTNLGQFTFVGIQERFEESLVLLQRTLGLELIPFLNRHVSAEGARPTVDEISDADRALIEEHNQLDIELYSFGRTLFEKAVAAVDGLAADAERLRTLSADVDAEAADRARRWLDRDAPIGGIPARTLRGAAREAGVQIAVLKRVVKELPLTHRVFLRPGEVESAQLDQQVQPLVALVHLPRTAGATVRSALEDAYTGRAVRDTGEALTGEDAPVKLARGADNWETWHRRGGRAVTGRVPYALLRQHLPADTRYVTFLREPVDRVLSHYYARVHHPELSRAERFERRERGIPTAASLEEAMADLRPPELCNLATRFFADGSPSARELLPKDLDDAKANLGELMLVGVQERFDESLLLLWGLLGLETAPHLDVNVSVRRPAVEDIPAEQRTLIEEQNRLDLELYAFGLGLFEDAVAAAADSGLAADAEALRAASANANQEALDRARDLLDRELPVGATKRKREIFAVARESDVPIEAVKHAAELMSVSKEHHDEGATSWTRIEAANGAHASRIRAEHTPTGARAD